MPAGHVRIVKLLREIADRTDDEDTWLTVQEHDGDESVVTPAAEERPGENDGLSDRQRWIVEPVGAGVKHPPADLLMRTGTKIGKGSKLRSSLGAASATCPSRS